MLFLRIFYKFSNNLQRLACTSVCLGFGLLTSIFRPSDFIARQNINDKFVRTQFFLIFFREISFHSSNTDKMEIGEVLRKQ